jgi:hypothetical protein
MLTCLHTIESTIMTVGQNLNALREIFMLVSIIFHLKGFLLIKWVVYRLYAFMIEGFERLI